MLTRHVVDMRHVTAPDTTANAVSPGVFDTLTDGLKKLPQPSFAADLRAAVD